ncbi:MAG: VWA domain-containing protein [Candidatus Obscuribacterales bacterium]|nr:VWA domain-containing protein [Candidatus Obscuribacterales bacterium]
MNRQLERSEKMAQSLRSSEIYQRKISVNWTGDSAWRKNRDKLVNAVFAFLLALCACFSTMMFSLAQILLPAALLLAPVLAPSAALAAQERERPVNFIFLVDVSGSMVLKSTMVKGPDGKDITLFEALRSALKQMVQDSRLIGPASQVSFITFGTAITEKADWPAKLADQTQRTVLIDKIVSPETLSADKHGDTYMGGALHAAVEKARAMAKEGDACTMTFIVMFTDGWDEPPAGAPHKVRDVSKQILLEKRISKEKVGVDTWQTRVVGLQRLPDSKAGTTTAKELATLIGGEFIDVNSQSGGTVSDRIFAALKRTVESLKGEIVLASSSNAAAAGDAAPNQKGMKAGVINFGNVDGNGMSDCSFPVELRSCYAEEVGRVEECSQSVDSGTRSRELSKLAASSALGSGIRLVASLPSDAVTVSMTQPDVVLAPIIPGRKYEGDKPTNLVPVTVQAHSNCPAGHFLGFLKMASTARVPQYVPFVVSVPSRLVVTPESIKVKVKKPGFFWPEPTAVEIASTIGQSQGAKRQTAVNVEVIPESALMKAEPGKSAATVYQNEKIDVANINDGNPLKFTYDASKGEKQAIKMNIAIPAKQKPGLYAGKLAVKVSGDSETMAPSQIPFEVAVDPSPWEEVAPVAVPLIIVCIIVCGLGIFLWLSTLKRSRQ